MRSMIVTLTALAALAACGKKPAAETEAAPTSVAATPSAEADNPATNPADDPDPDPVPISILLHTDADGVALGGYDAVSYFTGAPMKGDPAIASMVEGATYRFASAANKAAFDADPAAYRPQYGGYCAYGASQGGKFPTDPETGAVVGGKLYFNKNKSVQELWNKDRDALIVTADAKWPEIAYDEPQ